MNQVKVKKKLKKYNFLLLKWNGLDIYEDKTKIYLLSID